jgi:large subunit ribosomal protein L30
MMKKLKITLTRSLIGYKQDQRATVKALGLGKIGTSVVQEDNPTIRGMVHKVEHLVKVEEVEA